MQTIVLCEQRVNNDLFPAPRVAEAPASFAYKFLKYIQGKTKLCGDPYLIHPRQATTWGAAICKWNASLIHAHFGPNGLQMCSLAKALKRPLITSFHGNDLSAKLRSPAYLSALRKYLENGWNIAVCDAFRRRLTSLGAREDRTFTHYIGVPLADFSHVEREPVPEKLRTGKKILFLQVSNFVEKKGHLITIQAFAALLKRFTNWELIMAGDGPTKKSVMAQASREGVAQQVKFPGKLNSRQVAELMKSADVFLHHSIQARNGDEEGIPTAIMEAMARGLPVVATRHSGIPELIEHNESGVLVEEKERRGIRGRDYALPAEGTAICHRRAEGNQEPV